MYDHFFSFFGLRENPFHVSPDPRFYHPTGAQEAALAELLFGIESRQGIMVLTGEAGTGKTTLLNQLLDWLQRHNRSTAYVFHALLDPVELLQFILRDFGVPCSSLRKGDLVHHLHDWLLARSTAGDLPIVIIDEAQALPQQTLDELRLLLNLETPRGKLLQIILSGQPELDDKLRLHSLRQLRQRVMFHSRIPLLTPEETAAYISCRLAAAGRGDSTLFPQDVVQAVYASSRGIPRVVNLLCEHALISAYAEQRQVVCAEMIQRIAADFDLVAQPLAVTDAEVQPHYSRLAASFPVVDLAPRSSISSQSAAKVPPNPVVSRPAAIRPMQPPEPAAGSPAPLAPAAPVFQGIPKYWRRHRSRSAFAAFIRNSVKTPQKTRLALRTAVVARWRSLFDAKADADVSLPVPTPVRAVSVQHVARPAHPARVTTNSFVCYVRSVFGSFAQDCRHFFRALTMPSPALELHPLAAPSSERSAIHRNVIIPIAKWLREPISTGTLSHQRRTARTAARK